MNKAPTISVLHFLLTPEDTSAWPLKKSAPIAAAGWPLVKAIFWIALSVVAAMSIGQL